MTPEQLQRAWVLQAQADAERGVLECRMCRRRGPLEETTTLWRNGFLVFALCDRCTASHDVVFSPTAAGVELRAKRRSPVELVAQEVPRVHGPR
ncbi:hypothetical protein OV207_32415 [Corallococcus sp. BB11-1]|uniref:hypothetical protein n=1 Tax=Corallococcus sp. BB11-1 TaxID=2996783 RepID=UPI00226D4A19|nr:hypothetical protein [Corallococcus sp. BB11-1]MCY1036184.1 hypothetical protein [Corallococcus sp. BB11-1]